MSATRITLLLLALALSTAPATRARAQSTSGPGRAIVLVADSVLYAHWGEGEGARPGGRAILRDGRTGGVLDTLTVAWVRDAIAALPLRRPLAADAAGPAGLALEPLAADPAPPAVRGLLRVPIGSAPGTFDPLYVTSLAEKQVAAQVFQGLTRLDSMLTPRPALAESWEVERGRHVFRLRRDASFHSGRPVRAIDVQATLERALAPAAAAPRVEELARAIEGGVAYHTGRAPELGGVRVLDSLTVEIAAARPRAGLLAELATPAAFVVPAGTPPAPMGERELLAAQSGPFRLTGVSERAATFLAAPGRVGGPASLDMIFLPGPSEAAIEFELGRLDLVAPPEAIARRILARPGPRPSEVTIDEAATYYVGFDTRRPFVSDRGRRRALAGLIDRALAVRVLVPGRGRLARGLLPPVFGVEAPPESAWVMPRAEAERRSRRNFGGAAPALSFWVPEGSEVGLRMAEFVASAWRRAGLTVTIVERPWPDFQRGIAEGRADAFYLSWFADGPDPVAFVASMVESSRRGAGGNRTHYGSRAVDRALAESRTAPSERSARAALRRAERLALADAPLVPLFHSINVTLVRPGVKGVALDPLGTPRYDTVEVP
jgi:ABC-type transport system substrate-binding protein